MFTTYQDPKTSLAEKERIKATIINSNLRFAFKQAKYHSKRDPSTFETLIPAANEGLCVGFEKFNPKSGYRFLTYAGTWVNQRILKEMSQMRVVSVPIWKQQLSARIQKVLENRDNIKLSELVEEFPEVPAKDIKDLYQTQYLTYYIDDLDENEFEDGDVLNLIERKLDDERVWKAVAQLPSPHREVLAKIFGLEDGEECSIPQLCKAMKIPKNTLRAIQEEGLSMLKDLLLD